MNTAENKKIMQEIFSEWSKGNNRPLIEAMADDFSWTVSGTSRWARTYAGKESVLNDLLRPLGELFETQYSNTAHRFIAEEDLVVVECQGNVTTKKGEPYNNKYCFIFRLDDGRLKEVTEYMDTELVTKTLQN